MLIPYDLFIWKVMTTEIKPPTVIQIFVLEQTDRWPKIHSPETPTEMGTLKQKSKGRDDEVDAARRFPRGKHTEDSWKREASSCQGTKRGG